MTEARQRKPGGDCDSESRADVDNETPPRSEQHAAATASGHAAEPRGIQKGIADADKQARTGSTEESVRNTPPAGAWNDTSGD